MSNIKNFIKNILNNTTKDIESCSDNDLAVIINNIDCERFGLIRVSDYINAELSMIFLEISNNRKLFFQLLKKYDVKPKKINNQPIGYNKRDIERIYSEYYGKEKLFGK